MTDQYQQQPPPQYQQPPPQPAYAQQKANIYDHFVGPGKLGLFIFLSVGIMILGAILLNLVLSGVVDDNVDVLLFLGGFMLDMGIIIIIGLLFIAGMVRTDIPEGNRTMMLRAAGFALGLYVLAWALRLMFGGLGSMMYY